MSHILFTVRDPVSQVIRPEGTLARLDFNPTELALRAPEQLGKTSVAMDGRSGTTRIRGFRYQNRLAVDFVPISELTLVLDFIESMKYGYANPFFLDATDCPGQWVTQSAAVVDGRVEARQIGCTGVAFSFEYVEIAS